jgi:integrase
MSVRKNARTGAWVVRWRQDGKQPSKSFRTRRDAEIFEAEIIRRKQLGTLAQIDCGTRTLNDYVAEVWVPQHAERKLAANSRATYAKLYRVHLEQDLGSVRLRDVSPAMLRTWQDDRLRAGAGPSALNQALVLLGSILQRATEDEEIARNPARIVRKVATERAPEIVALSPRQVELVRAQVDGIDRLLIAVLAYAGLRPSEAWALTWGDVQERTIRVTKATDGFGAIKGTKTGTARTVRLLAPLEQDLREWRMQQGRPADGTLIFPSLRGEVTTKDQQARWRRFVWGPAWKAAAAAMPGGAGTPVPRVYDLRHSFASLLLAGHRSPHYVAKQLGHNASMTISTYGHVVEDFEDQPRVDPEATIWAAREAACAFPVRSADTAEAV